MSVRDKWVRRFSIDETAKHKNGFTIYKITSVLFPLESPEAVTVVSVWKRYSDVQRLHKAMSSLHAGLHLRGTFPVLAKSSYFKRFHEEVIQERAKTIKALMEFVAEHRLLFTSTDFVNFLQTGYPEPEPAGGVINAIRSSLHLPIEDSPPLEYQTSDDEARTPSVRTQQSPQHTTDNRPEIDNIDVSQIPIYEAADVEIRESPKTTERLADSNSFESINSLESLGSDLFEELNKVAIDNKKPFVKKNVLPDLITFDAPSTSTFDDYHTMRNMDAETISLNSSTNEPSSSACDESRRSSSRVSVYSKRSVPSLSGAESRTRTEDSYIFEAGYLLNLAARCEDAGQPRRAFDCYKAGIEKMLIGVQTDSDPQRRALIKDKTNKYLAYAEAIYKNHLCNADQTLLEREASAGRAQCGVPAAMLRRPYAELAQFRVLGVLGAAVMLVLHKGEHSCYAMKVIQKIPNNLTEFDNYFQQRTDETRQPILPTFIPYMVPLHAYVETNNLLFLILDYAPGGKLFDYIKNYAKSVPDTPARGLNLENVFAEPKNKNDNESVDVTDANVNIETRIAVKLGDSENKFDNKIKIDDTDTVNIDRLDIGDSNKNDSITKLDNTENVIDSRVAIDGLDDVNENLGTTDRLDDMDVSELVINSQKLLLNVDKALTDVPRLSKTEEDGDLGGVGEEQGAAMGKEAGGSDKTVAIPSQVTRGVLPPSRVCLWGAQILTALESLHNAGVICSDLNPANVLLGARGQALLTYCVGYASAAAPAPRRAARAYLAPELRERAPPAAPQRASDFWSFGALMYELLCGRALGASQPHLWSHSIIQLPDGVPLEARSLVTQLLAYEPAERLGAGGIDDIKRHPYFRHVHWQQLYERWLVPD
ncbi:ribosomal protein S6 kinase-like 1 isoform X2 [Pararge aegeria]|uniref:ribosomal protein S6 kinase-like 1 isoform X2 n=1 Tax=Pararge aegeria TaxID=116150 RepID=UPI0019D050A7|nr:ribosomal protein S6 kinase-like 1 isoform X2 [Pararge aegeria]